MKFLTPGKVSEACHSKILYLITSMKLLVVSKTSVQDFFPDR